jgi:hypothetical protein
MLELRPNSFSGHGEYKEEIVLTLYEKLDDDNETPGARQAVSLNIEELKNAIKLLEEAEFEQDEREPCSGCGRP